MLFQRWHRKRGDKHALWLSHSLPGPLPALPVAVTQYWNVQTEHVACPTSPYPSLGTLGSVELEAPWGSSRLLPLLGTEWTPRLPRVFRTGRLTSVEHSSVGDGFTGDSAQRASCSIPPHQRDPSPGRLGWLFEVPSPDWLLLGLWGSGALTWGVAGGGGQEDTSTASPADPLPGSVTSCQRKQFTQW